VSYSENIDWILINGRNIAIALAVVLALINYRNIFKVIRMPRSKLIEAFLMFQVFFIVKIWVYGDKDFALQGAAILFLLGVVTINVIDRIIWFDDQFISKVLLAFSVAFVVVNIYVYVVYQDISAVHGRLFATMVNPQHLTMTSALALPAVFGSFLIERRSRLSDVLGIVVCSGLMFIIFKTGSRTGLFVAAFSLLTLIILKYKAKVALFLAFSVALTMLLHPEGAFFVDEVSEYTSRGDTRSEIWQDELDYFIKNPLFGKDLNAQGRVAFSESLWLSILSNAGIFGLVITIYLMSRIIKLIILINKLQTQTAQLKYVYSISLSIIFFMSFFESLFAGYLTSMTYLSCLYFLGAERLIATDKRLANSAPLRPA